MISFYNLYLIIEMSYRLLANFCADENVKYSSSMSRISDHLNFIRFKLTR